MRLGMNELKAELRKRGRSIGGKKAELQARLKEAIENNVPIASGREAPSSREYEWFGCDGEVGAPDAQRTSGPRAGERGCESSAPNREGCRHQSQVWLRGDICSSAIFRDD